ncbi:MAG: ribosome maturation factor RimP [Proteobacteria bacterium]|nr:ribosome maturation factor RimP [Pseudomonadota bacterium]
MPDRATEIAALLTPTVASMQLELLGVEFAPSGAHALLRLYIDAPGRAVTVDDCEAVSREVSALLDVEDPIASHYTLEVSSPGIDRPLFTAAQFARHAGEQVKLALHVPVGSRRRVQGVILAVEGEDIAIRVGEEELKLQHANIDKARLVPDWGALGLGSAPAGKGKAAGGKKTGGHHQRHGGKPGRKTRHKDDPHNGGHDGHATEHER